MSDRFDHTLEHKLESKPGDGGDDAVTAVRRIELITGAGRRRPWSGDEKARIIIESLRPGVNVSEVARRNGLSPQQLFGWRREARALVAGDGAGADAPKAERPVKLLRGKRGQPGLLEGARSPAEGQPGFAPVVIAASTAPPSQSPAPPTDTTRPGRIEIAIGDAVVRIVGQVETALLATVLRAVRRAS